MISDVILIGRLGGVRMVYVFTMPRVAASCATAEDKQIAGRRSGADRANYEYTPLCDGLTDGRGPLLKLSTHTTVSH